MFLIPNILKFYCIKMGSRCKGKMLETAVYLTYIICLIFSTGVFFHMLANISLIYTLQQGQSNYSMDMIARVVGEKILGQTAFMEWCYISQSMFCRM